MNRTLRDWLETYRAWRFGFEPNRPHFRVTLYGRTLRAVGAAHDGA